MRRGEVWWAELPAPIRSRPVVVLTRNAVVDTIGAVVVALVTTRIRGLATEVRVGQREGLPQPSVISLDNLLTVPKSRLVRVMGALSAQKVIELNTATKVALELK